MSERNHDMNNSGKPKNGNKEPIASNEQAAIVKRVIFDDPQSEYREQNQKINTYQPSKNPLL